MIEGIQDAGLWSKGSGADNIRNVTGTPTAGVDPQELLDTRPFARAMHHHILNDRSLYRPAAQIQHRLRRRRMHWRAGRHQRHWFSGGRGRSRSMASNPGVYFRLALGGITGHKDFARDTGVIVPPDEAIEVADKILRVFIEHGDRTNRAKARLKYVLDALGLREISGACRGEARPRLVAGAGASARSAPAPGSPGAYWRASAKASRPQLDRRRSAAWTSHGRANAGAGRHCARRSATAAIRLTVWQNLLLTGVRGCARRGRGRRDRGARTGDAGLAASRRSRRLHWQFRLSFRGRRHQASRGRDRGAFARRRRRSIRQSISI